MRILWVKPGKLLPLDSGGKLRSYNILRHLSEGHEVTYLSYYGGARDPDYEQELLRRFADAVPIHVLGPERKGWSRWLEYARHLPQAAPFAVSQFASRRVRAMIAEWMSQCRFDVAVCDFLASTPNFPGKLATTTVLFQHNVETVLWRRRAEFASNAVARTVARIEHFKMARYEARQVRRFHRVLAVSEADREAMASMTDRSRIGVIPTGVDLPTYHYDPSPRLTFPLVVFTGSMDWEPNIDAVEYFCNDIWPYVLDKVPEAVFRIVGRDPQARVKKLASTSVQVAGTVESIVEHLREAAVLVVPLRIGGGTRIKIYEGMAIGRATVSTRVGAEGLDVHHGRDILLADDPRVFAEHVICLLQSEEVRRRYEVAAAAKVRKYDWSIIAQQLANELQIAILSGLAGHVVPRQIAVT